MAAKVFDKDVVGNPDRIGFMLIKSPRFFDILNNPIRVTGPMKVFASKLKESNRKNARVLEKEIDDLERKMKSASKYHEKLGWILMMRDPDLKGFRSHANYNQLKDFQKKLSEIRKVLEVIQATVLKYAK